jgi:hypothetical protein
MTIGLLFWILYIVGLVFYGFGLARSRDFDAPSMFWWVLIALLGVGVFGGPIK